LEEYRNNASRYPANFLLRSILSCAKNFPDPLEFVAKGNWLINLGSYDLAILQYLEALAINPLIERGDFWLGYCLYKKGDYDYAKIFAKRALEVSPSEPEALLLSAELNKQTDIPKAYLYYRYALKSNPHSAMVRELLADFAFSQGLDKEAIVQYHWLSRRFPADMKYLLRTAVLCGKTGKFNEARHLLEQAITVDPKNVDAHFNLAVAYRYLGLLNLSKKELKSTLSLNPGHPQARVYLGELEHL
jgi:tetratricopeptide (TPR) repeat protein